MRPGLHALEILGQCGQELSTTWISDLVENDNYVVFELKDDPGVSSMWLVIDMNHCHDES